MSSGITAVIIVVVIIVIAVAIVMAMAARRRRLQQQFGDEYDRALAEKVDQPEQQRQNSPSVSAGRCCKYDIRPLSPEAKSRYLGEWQAIQEQFVDSPQTAVAEAYALVTTVMQERGYPPVEDDQVADDLSVRTTPTPSATSGPRRPITREAAHGSIATEDLRQAFIHFRELFADLLGDVAGNHGLNGTAPAATAAAQASGPVGRRRRTAGRPDDLVTTRDFTDETAGPVDTDPGGRPAPYIWSLTAPAVSH